MSAELQVPSAVRSPRLLQLPEISYKYGMNIMLSLSKMFLRPARPTVTAEEHTAKNADPLLIGERRFLRRGTVMNASIISLYALSAVVFTLVQVSSKWMANTIMRLQVIL